MPLVRSRALALAGLAGLAVIAVAMLRDGLDLVGAAGRAGLLVIVLVAVERIVLPLARELVGTPSREDRPS